MLNLVYSHLRVVMLIISLLALPILLFSAEDAVEIRNSKIIVRAVGSTGFDLISKNKTAAVVKFSSNNLITANERKISSDGKSIVFSKLTGKVGSGLEFGSSDNIEVSLSRNDPYPKVSFNLTIKSFDPKKWQNVAGKQPFHFLAIYMPDAKVWHQHGWLNETPVADPFPLLQDVHVGTPEISAYKYNRNWSYTIPLGGHPTPVIGLWAPESKHYAGFEFESTRLTDNSEKDVATGYCWGDGKAEFRKPNPDQFVSLVYPHGGRGFQDLVFPAVGSVISTYGKLIWSLDLPAANDPNRFFYTYIWDRYRSKLPSVPTTVNFDWLPGDGRLEDFAAPGSYGTYIVSYTGSDALYVEPGSKFTLAWTAYNESIVAHAKSKNDKTILDKVQSEAEKYLEYAKYDTIDGEECIFWEKPLEGKFVEQWGGAPVTSIQNPESFVTGRLFLDLYQYLDKTEYLAVVDKVFNWAKHIGWTRNELIDIPSSPSGIGALPCQSFCLAYYMAFKDAPDKYHRSRAKEALDLARTFAYRYMSVWISDSNRMDNLHPAFQWEVTSGRDWTAAACTADMMIDVQAMTAVHTGDPLLMRVVYGSLNKFHDMYQNTYRDSITGYSKGNFSEAYGFYDGCTSGVGNRVPFGGMFQIVMLQPVGSSSARVLAGEKSAMVFNKGGNNIKINEYRYTPDGNFSFIVDGNSKNFDLSITAPYIDISGKSVYRIRNDKKSMLALNTDFIRPSHASWSIMVKNVSAGDKIIVGEPKANSRILPSSPENPAAKRGVSYKGFDIINLKYDTKPNTDWQKKDSYAGIPSGELWVFGIPFDLKESTDLCMVGKKTELNKPITNADSVFLLYTSGEGKAPSVVFDDGSSIMVDSEHESLAWRAWPPIYKSRLLISYVDTHGKRITAIDPGDRYVSAVTAHIKRKSDALSIDYKGSLASASDEWKKLKQEEVVDKELNQAAAKVAKDSIAILSPSALGPTYDFLLRAGLSSKSVILTPEQLIEPDFFTPKNFPVAFYASDGTYTHTVKSPGDAADAIVKYVQDGGTLIISPPGAAFPFYIATGPGFSRGEPLVDRLGMPIDFVFEDKHPEQLYFEINSDQSVLKNAPGRYAWPYGDTRLRVIAKDQLPQGTKYTPIYSVVGESGKVYGDSAALIELPNNGGKLLFVFGIMTSDRDNGPRVASSVIAYLIELLSTK